MLAEVSVHLHWGRATKTTLDLVVSARDARESHRHANQINCPVCRRQFERGRMHCLVFFFRNVFFRVGNASRRIVCATTRSIGSRSARSLAARGQSARAPSAWCRRSFVRSVCERTDRCELFSAGCNRLIKSYFPRSEREIRLKSMRCLQVNGHGYQQGEN